LYNRTEHHANFFGKKVVILHFEFSPQWTKKKPKGASRGSHEGNKFCILDSVFWMELNMTLKILPFCISSFQSS
jgi:hypothetical protein